MKKYNSLSVILLVIAFICVGGCKKKSENLFSIDSSKFKSAYYITDTLSVAITNTDNLKIDSIIYFVNDKKIGSKKESSAFSFALKDQRLGYQNMKAQVFYAGEAEFFEATSRIELVSNIKPKLFKYEIVNSFVHDTTSFTEGLEFYKDTLYESTGLRGKSHLLKTDFKTGKILKSLKLADQYFGEGITIINDKIFQLTWEEKTGFIYDAKTWKLEKTFKYDKEIEGWGMTNDGTFIYQTDKTEKIWKMDPNNQKMIDYINVYSGDKKIPSINELEWIDGKIYSNIWQKDFIAIINPNSGAVESVLDLSGLRKFLKNKSSESLNGIAYNSKTKTIFVTGKYWDKLFEIRVK